MIRHKNLGTTLRSDPPVGRHAVIVTRGGDVHEGVVAESSTRWRVYLRRNVGRYQLVYVSAIDTLDVYANADEYRDHRHEWSPQ